MENGTLIVYMMLSQPLVCLCMLTCARLVFAAISAEIVLSVPKLPSCCRIQHVFGMDVGEARLVVSLVAS